jgi:hypothetical protein
VAKSFHILGSADPKPDAFTEQDRQLLQKVAQNIERLLLIHSHLQVFLEREEARRNQKPGLTVSEFARRVGLSRWTIQQRLRENRLTKVGGRIPYSQLLEYLS